MRAPGAEPQRELRPSSRLYGQALLFVVVPLVAALAVLLVQNSLLVREERDTLESRLVEANRQAQFALTERVERTRHAAELLGGSRDVVQALARRDNEVLHSWGSRIIAAGLATEVYFLAVDGQVMARGHGNSRFGDRYSDALVSGSPADRVPYAGIVRLRGGMPAFAARMPVVRFDAQWIGSVLLYFEIAPPVLAGLGVAPDIAVELLPGSAPGDAEVRKEYSNVTGTFDVAAGGERFHLRLTRSAPEELDRLQRLNLTLWVLAAFALFAMPALTAYALHRLLLPARLLHRQLSDFAAGRSSPGTLLREIRSLAAGRNELAAIAAAVADALEALQAAQSDLVQAQKLAGLGAMVAGVSHEIGTPLGNSLVATTTLRARAQELDAEIAQGSLRRSSLERFLAHCAEATRILESSLNRASGLLKSFKQVAVDEASGGRREFGLAEVVADVVLTMSPTLKRPPVEVAIEVPEDIRMDSFPGALSQVLANLIQNAALHGLEGAARGRVRVDGAARGERVVLRVADDGRGIPPEVIDRVFDRFFTTRAGKGGSGLGLHICRELVTGILGGTISVQSQSGAGATFTVELPRVAPQSGAPGEGAPKGATAGGAETPPAAFRLGSARR